MSHRSVHRRTLPAMEDSPSDSQSMAPRAVNASTVCPLLAIPHDVWVSVACGLQLREMAACGASCQFLLAENADEELWLHLFMASCWPPSNALLAFAENAGGRLACTDWRDRLQTRMRAPATIVVDIGRGYTKWGVVHGVRGRSEGNTLRPQFVQLSSSSTSPADCAPSQQLNYIEHKLDRLLLRAAQDSSDPLHAVAVGSCFPEVATSEAHRMCGRLCCFPQGFISERRIALGHKIAVLHKFHEETCSWSLKLRSSGQNRRTSSNSSYSAPQHLAAEAQEARDAEGYEQSQGHEGSSRDLQQEMLPEEELIILARSTDLRLIPLACELPMLLGEPFLETARRGQEEADVEVGASRWALSQRQQLGRDRLAPVHVVEQARMSLWAHGIDHGLVVNIGQRITVAIPVINGKIVASMAMTSDASSVDLTQRMHNLVAMNRREDLLTWSRDMKELHCYVAPPSPHTRGLSLVSRLRAGDDFGIEAVTVQTPQGHEVTLDRERVLVPEFLFEAGHGLPELLTSCVEACLEAGECDGQGARDLLRQIVLVGGAAEFPGLRPRVEFEVRELLRHGENMFPKLREAFTSSGEVFVLNPPLGRHGPITTPRFAPFVGGCIRAATSLPLSNLSSLTAELPAPFASQRRQTIRNDILARLFNVNDPAMFRAGGGGGFDDQIWMQFRDAYDRDSESEDDPGEDEGDSSEQQADEHRDDDDDEDEGGEEEKDDDAEDEEHVADAFSVTV